MKKLGNALAVWFTLVVVLAIFVFVRPAGTNVVEVQAPTVVMDVLDPRLEGYAALWQAEIARRFPNSVGVLVHGGDFVAGQWIMGAGVGRHVMPVGEVIDLIKKRHPGRTIVLLACNTGHVKLNISGVYYARASVWCVPDRAITAAMYKNYVAYRTLDGLDGQEASEPEPTRWQSYPDVVGNIYEFVTD